MEVKNMWVGRLSSNQMPESVSTECKDEIYREILEINIKREKVLAIILIIVLLTLLALNTIVAKVLKWNSHVFMGFSIYHVILLAVPVAFLYLTCTARESIRENLIFKNILHIAINTTVVMLCSIIAFYNISDNKQPFAYTIAIFCIASLILFKPSERIVVFSVPYVSCLAAMVVFQHDVMYRLEGLFFFTLLTLIAFMVSFINYKSNVKNFINNRIIIENNKRLDEMNRTAQNSLKERTEELNEVIEYEKLRTNFFANISHELRTPLTIISSAQQMLRLIFKENMMKEKVNEINQYIQMMGQNCNRLLRLISNLIDITKIDAGYFNVNLQNYDIVNVVENITLSIAKYIEDTNINLTFDTEIEEKVIACDPEKIERIMLNLLSNAVKFTPRGGEIFVYMYDRNDKIIISVKDTGIGVPADMKDMIFERFVQVDKTTTRRNEGSGIGLSIVKSLVDMHNGSISLTSEPGKGSEFVIELPDRVVESTEAVKEYNLVKEDRSCQKIIIEFSDISL